MDEAGQVEDALVKVGRDLGWRDIPVTAERVQQHMDAVDDYHPWYRGDSPWGGPIAPAMLFNREPVWHRGWFLSNTHGTLLARQDWELYRPVMVGDTVRSH